jgi:aconitate hydratase
MPAGNRVLPLRSNIPAISGFLFAPLDASLAERARAGSGGLILGGENYGQGSSREHAALAPRYLGIRAKLVKSYARIHRANLINFGILPLTLVDPDDYERIRQGDRVRIPRVRDSVQGGLEEIPFLVNGSEMRVRLQASERQRRILLSGGVLNLVRDGRND